MRTLIRPLTVLTVFAVALLITAEPATADPDGSAQGTNTGESAEGTAQTQTPGDQPIGDSSEGGDDDGPNCWYEPPRHTTQEEQRNDIREEETAGREGRWGWRVCDDGTEEFVFFPDAEPVDPEFLARSVVLTPPRPLIEVNPSLNTQQVVNLESWYWIASGTWAPQSTGTSAGSVTVEVTITPNMLVIDPGDGSGKIECPDGGTPYDRSRSADSQSSECTHIYKRAGTYTATAEVVYNVSWTSNVQPGGSLGTLTSPATSFDIQVAESQAIVTD